MPYFQNPINYKVMVIFSKVLDIFAEEILTDASIDWQKIEEKYNSVYTQEHIIPDWLFNQIKKKL